MKCCGSEGSKMNCCMFEKVDDPKKKAALDKINAIGLALFLLMMGGLLIMPKGTLPESSWLVGLGLILIGGNIARYLNKIKFCTCGLVIGALMLASGICGIYGITFPFFPALLIIIAVGIIWGLITKKKNKA